MVPMSNGCRSNRNWAAAALSAVLAVAAATPVAANSIGEVEGARAHERMGSYLTRQEVEKLRRYGGNDDGYYSGGYGFRAAPGFGPDFGPDSGVEVVPGDEFDPGLDDGEPYDDPAFD